MLERIRLFAIALDTIKFSRRLVLISYGYMLWSVVSWFMTIPQPTIEQAGFASTVVGAAIGVFGFYTNRPAQYEKLAQAKQQTGLKKPCDDYNKPPDDFWDEQSEFDITQRID